MLLAAVMLWDVLFRGQLGLSMSFLEEMWARNLGHLFVTPLRPYEWVLSLLSMSMIRVLLGILPAALLAIPLYHYSIFSMGLPLVAFFAVLLVMGWALGMAICGLILRQGMGAEGLAWTVVFTLSPISCCLLPGLDPAGWLQHAAWALPSTYVFEGMRAVLFSGIFRTDYLLHRAGARRLLRDARRRRLFVRLPRRPPARRAVADGRVSDRVCRPSGSRVPPFGSFQQRARRVLIVAGRFLRSRISYGELGRHLLYEPKLVEQNMTKPGVMPAETVLEIENLQTHFFTPAGVVRAVDGVSYSVRSGETLGWSASPGAARA